MRYETTPVAALAISALCVLSQACGSSDPPGSPDLAQASSGDAAMPGDVDLAGGADLAIPAGSPYASPGPETATTTTKTATLGGDQVTLTLTIPATAGPRPVVVISPGFQQPAAGYKPYADRFASFGMIAISRNDPGFVANSPTTAGQLTDLVATWLPAANGDSTGPLFGRVDVTKVGLIGHSRGGQVSFLAAADGLKGKVAGVFGLDPVDTSQSGAQARTTIGGLGVPSVFLGETLDGTSIFGFGMACAPTADNYHVLHGAAPSPSLELTVNGADHYDFEVASQAIGAALCHSGTADSGQVLDMAVALSTGFFARELLGEPVGAGLDGAGAAGYIASGLITRAMK